MQIKYAQCFFTFPPLSKFNFSFFLMSLSICHEKFTIKRVHQILSCMYRKLCERYKIRIVYLKRKHKKSYLQYFRCLITIIKWIKIIGYFFFNKVHFQQWLTCDFFITPVTGVNVQASYNDVKLSRKCSSKLSNKRIIQQFLDFFFSVGNWDWWQTSH